MQIEENTTTLPVYKPGNTIFDVIPGFVGTTVYKVSPIPTFSVGTTPFDGGVATASSLTGSTLKNCIIYCNNIAKEGLRLHDIVNPVFTNIVIKDSVEKGCVLGSLYPIGQGDWFVDKLYSIWDPDNNTIAARVTHNGTDYYCKLAHRASASTEPGVGVDWATYWAVETSFAGAGLANFNGEAFGEINKLFIINDTLGNTSHCLVIYQAIWFATIKQCGIVHQLGDGVQALAGDNYTLDRFFINQRSSEGTPILHSNGATVVANQLVIWDPDGVHFNGNLVTFNHQYPQDHSKLRIWYKAVADGTLTADATTDPNLTLVGNELDVCRPLVVYSTALDFRFQRGHCRNGTARIVNLQDSGVAAMDDLFVTGMGGNGASSYDTALGIDFKEMDPQHQFRILADVNSQFRVDYGNNATSFGNQASTVFANNELISSAGSYSFSGQQDKAPYNTKACTTYITDDTVLSRFQRIDGYQFFSGSHAVLGNISSDYELYFDSTDNYIPTYRNVSPDSLGALNIQNSHTTDTATYSVASSIFNDSNGNIATTDAS